MNEKPKGIGSISLLLFTAVLSVWLGVAGPLFGHRPWIHSGAKAASRTATTTGGGCDNDRQIGHRA
jgi:hypothetical protein